MAHFLYIYEMLYLFASVLLFSINNLLWKHFTLKQNIYVIMFKRSSFTCLFIGVILAVVLFYNRQEFTPKEILNLFMISSLGFAGLSFLVLGFKKGSILQYAIYSLLFTFILGFTLEYQINHDWYWNIFSLLFVSFGYLYFIFKQFKEQTITLKSGQAHLYFFLAHCCFSMLLILQMDFLERIPEVAIAFIQELCIFIFAGIIISMQPRTSKAKKIPIWQFAIFALPITLAVFLGLKGLKVTSPFYSSLMGLLTPIITLVLGIFLGNEKLNLKSLLGLLMIVVGMLIFYLN